MAGVTTVATTSAVRLLCSGSSASLFKRIPNWTLLSPCSQPSVPSSPASNTSSLKLAVMPDIYCLHRQFVFRDFSVAFGFMSRVASVAEEMDHHPNWCNVYNRVDVFLSTHNKGVTEKDFKLAEAMDKINKENG